MSKKFSAFWKDTVVEKPGDSSHTAKWDKCVEHVKAEGSGANAYAVCTAAIGDESYKASETDEEFKARVDGYIKRLNITSGVPSTTVDASRADKMGVEGAGPVPNSLLARQDLETTKSFRIAKGANKDITVDVRKGSFEVAKAVFENTELSAIMLAESYNGHDIFMTPEMEDADGKRVGCYIVVGQDYHLQVFFDLKDAYEFIDSVFAKSETEVQETGKQLDAAAEEAKSTDTEDASDLASRIKQIQVKRQKATIAARTKEAMGKSFKDSWKKLSKADIEMPSAMFSVRVTGANSYCVFERAYMTFDVLKEVLANVKEDYKGHTIEVTNDLGMREVYFNE